MTVSLAVPRVYNNPILPGIPISHSRDWVNWEQIGHVLDRLSQIALDSIRFSGGIDAPTIRYNKGVFNFAVGTLVGAIFFKGGSGYRSQSLF